MYRLPVAGGDTVEVLEGAGIVLQAPGDGAIPAGLIDSSHRIAQKEAGKHGCRVTANCPVRGKDHAPNVGNRLRLAGNGGLAGELESVGANESGWIAHIGAKRETWQADEDER